MLSKCANPACSANFRYLHEGRLFHVEIGLAAPGPENVARFERFWLCEECSKSMTVVSRPGGVSIIPLEHRSQQQTKKRWLKGVAELRNRFHSCQ
jgi:hypothetical protein